MILTLFKLWVELDRLAVAQSPLLKTFSPEIPPTLLHSLLLRTSESIKALDYVENYLKNRHSNSVPGRSVFAYSVGPSSFAGQYFDCSKTLQALRGKIEETAKLQREKKIEELQELKTKHQGLLNAAQELEHQYVNRFHKGKMVKVNAPQCERCKLENKAASVQIEVHEWPLPQDPWEAKAVVFELSPPNNFVIWRNITYMLLRDLCIPDSATFPREPVRMRLPEFPGLKPYYKTASNKPRIILASMKKSFVQTHYKVQKITVAMESSICVQHGLHWRLLDSAKTEWVTQQVTKCSINDHCTLRVPPGRYQSLQYAVSGTSHTSNEIVARKTECPSELTLPEFIAFARIRSGPRLQWLNIISELRSASLNFQEEAVYSLLKQAVWQVGPSNSDGQREWHVELTEPTFAQVLLTELQDLLHKTRGNRRNVVGMQVITALVGRLLASSTDDAVIQRSFKIMREVRRVTYYWLDTIVSAMQDIEGEEHLQECQMHICEVAATCRSTYDINPDKLPSLLTDHEDVSIFIHCAILFTLYSPTTVSDFDSRFRDLLLRDRRLSHIAEPLLWQYISESRDGIDQAIVRIWKGYRPSTPWRRSISPNERCVLTISASSQSVHVDLLSGQMLIDGKPLGRLPKDISTHPTYIRIFGKKFMDVIPADMPGMDYKTSSPIGSDPGDESLSGYQVYFALSQSVLNKDSSQLVIRIQRDEEILELIPHDVFKNDLPVTLMKDQTHWLNITTSKGEIEIRDLKTWWKSSPGNWRIYFSPKPRSSTCLKLSDESGTLKLIDPRSATMSMISTQLRPLENPEYLIITHSSSSDRLTVSLPRFRLDFFLNDQRLPRLESLNMPGMMIDANQSSQTMIGLKSQLVLRSKDSVKPYKRMVIVPYTRDPGFNISPLHHHLNITLSFDNQPSIRYFRYTINSTLGRLDGDGTMLSKLYQTYLHAITSHCLPDPLIGRTGTEEALQQLRSAGMVSFQKLGEDEHGMLERISALTPTRTFYPSHIKVMQTVGWSKHAICPLGQHGDFYVLSHSIWSHAETLRELTHSQDEGWQVDFRETSDHLLQRAAYQNAIYYRDPIGNPDLLSCKGQDSVYHSRGRSTYTTAADEGVVINTSIMVLNWESTLRTHNQLFNALQKYGSISGTPRHISLAYSREWVDRKMGDIFLPACKACQAASRKKNQYQILFSFSACVYASEDARQFIPTIFAFATNPELCARNIPPWSTYNLSLGSHPTEGKLAEIILARAIQSSPSTESPKKKMKEQPQTFSEAQELEFQELMGILKRRWPCTAPVIPDSRQWGFDIPELEKEAATLFTSWMHNKDLLAYSQDIQSLLDNMRCTGPVRNIALYTLSPVSLQPSTIFNYITLRHLVAQRDPPTIPSPPTPALNPLQSFEEKGEDDMSQLKVVLSQFRKSTFLARQNMAPASIQERYVDDLETSLQSLETEVKTKSSHQSKPERPAMEIWRDHQNQCEEHVKTTYELVRKSLLPSTPAEIVLLHAGLWPCLAPTSLLTALSDGSEVVLNMQWRRTLNSFVRGLLAFQHSCRLMELLREENLEEFYNELKSNVMDAGGDDEQGSIRLLIQVDCNFLTRKVQTDFLREMIAPASQRNTVLQLNMGEGKSSVIVPIAAALLSDGTKLVRIVVLRPLAPSMMHILVHRLGGLANRRVFYIPFSRTPRLTLDQAYKVRQIFEMCVQERGVLVVQPDHILSFRLMGLDGKLNNPFSPESTICSHLLDSQRWLFNNSRDILDESDEILHVKYQLVYTIGQQQCLHGNQDRWTIAQQILGLVKKHARAISRSYPDGVELMDDHSGGYPHVRILHDEAGTALIHVIAEDILNGALDHFSFDLFPRELRSFALSYITSLEIAADEEHLLEEYCKNHDSWMNLLIIRGLLAHGILQFVLKEKRWCVDYGPDLSRSLLAVPYRAKDVPALRAEFSHPDVAILLTCLSYYWQGLSQNQLEQCFNLLFQQDNPPLEYSKWILQGQGIPESLTHLEAINLRDLDQRTELYTIFHHNQAVIDFFLSQVVFPRGAREFPKKMATSGWDLAEQKTHVTTGFSGTNDGRYLLPTSIKQADPLSQSSTNAKVLMYLLQSENDHYHLIHQVGQENLEESLLHLIVEQKPEIRVLLDVGAQILKLSNEDVAAEWLRLNKDPQVLAAVFFGSDDEPYVRTRDGQIEGLVSSPFRQQLDKCLLYLDDAHTRGTDFKLPPGTRAAVTLGPKVTKDRLVQGCMRMRKLGRGHTIMFFAPLEVDHSIRVSAGVSRDNPIQTKDVVLWTMFESCLEVQHRIPQWAQQGMDYRKREAAWIRFNKSPNFSMKHLEAAWLQNDARSLEEMYGHDQVGSMMGFGRQLEEYPDISATYRKWALSAFNDTRLQEEQEREVVLEVETERRVVRPMPATAAIPHVAGDIRMLVNSGRFERYSAAFVPLFQRLGEERFEEQSWSSRGLFATRDFCITIRSSRDSNPVNYLRPVQWILSCAQPTETIFFVLSPHEVNELLPDIRNSNQVHLHLYSPRTTQGMKSFEDLAFYCIPPLPASWIKPDLDITTRLNLWAGQLYLEDEKNYHYLCNFLGLYNWQPRKRDKIQPDGFIKPLNRYGTPVANSSFLNSPVPFLKRLFAIRRNGVDYAPTHMGKILQGRLLTEEDFQVHAVDSA